MRRPVFPLIFSVLLFSSAGLVGCSSTKRIYSAEYDGDRQISLDWVIGERIERSRWDPESTGGVPPLSRESALVSAEAVLPDYVRNPEEWPLSACDVVELKPGCYAYAVSFRRKPGFEDRQAGDALVYLYVLMDGSVVVPVVTYAR